MRIIYVIGIHRMVISFLRAHTINQIRRQTLLENGVVPVYSDSRPGHDKRGRRKVR